MPQAKLYYKAVALPLEYFLIFSHLKTPLDHRSIQFKSLEFLTKKKRERKGKMKGVGQRDHSLALTVK